MLIYYISSRTVWSLTLISLSSMVVPSSTRSISVAGSILRPLHSTVTTGGRRYSGHEPQSVQSLLQSSSSVNEMWDSTVYYILQETNDEYYLVNIQVLHQTYTTYIYYESKSVTD